MEERTAIAGKLRTYLRDPFLNLLYSRIRQTGPIRSISVDLTPACNLRCLGCYFFAEDLDRHEAAGEARLDALIERD
ncbi:MAG: hypothetical protein HYX74_10070 [Acidobacteria bacterium]|nr:hypothetical protein [Acidobacteriota bacterium]